MQSLLMLIIIMLININSNNVIVVNLSKLCQASDWEKMTSYDRKTSVRRQGEGQLQEPPLSPSIR